MINVRIYWGFFLFPTCKSSSQSNFQREVCGLCGAIWWTEKSVHFTVGLREKLSLFGMCVSEYRRFVSDDMTRYVNESVVTCLGYRVCPAGCGGGETAVHSGPFTTGRLQGEEHVHQPAHDPSGVSPGRGEARHRGVGGGVVVGERCTHGPMRSRAAQRRSQEEKRIVAFSN